MQPPAPTRLFPQRPEERAALRRAAERIAAGSGLVPPAGMEALSALAARAAAEAGLPPEVQPLALVLCSNALWRETVARVPPGRRLLLLPQCLRQRTTCPAPCDELGLLCAGCGACPIAALEAEAEALGTPVLVAEGASAVGRLIARGGIDAVIGVGCLDSLARSFPRMLDAALPGLAIPLLGDGCDATTVDLEWIREALLLRAPGAPPPNADLTRLRTRVRAWFTPPALEALLGPASGEAETVARDWLALDGKRWRPLLTAAAAASLGANVEDPALRATAIAVECFHKASLAHDDIEDGDDERYGSPALHARHGLPAALNAGDLLIGLGYRLLSSPDLPPPLRLVLASAAAEGHCLLCRGQGEELAWLRTPRRLGLDEALRVAAWKTGAAFRVGLELGCLLADPAFAHRATLGRYSDELGIAYQSGDDLADLPASPEALAAEGLRPGLALAFACEAASGSERALLQEVLAQPALLRSHAEAVHALLCADTTVNRLRALREERRAAALAALDALPCAGLKALLFRMTGLLLPRPPEETRDGE